MESKLNDLISRKDVLDEIFILEFFYSHHDVIRKFCERLNASVGKLPAVDAVEVVRCKDCNRRYDADECPMCCLIGGESHDYTADNGYCDRGERKENV